MSATDRSAASPGTDAAPSLASEPTRRATIRDYVAVTKPRIIELLLVTTVPSMILAAGGWPPIGTAVAVLIGGTLAAAGANAFNSVYDADIDRLMHRTRNRPVAAGVVSPRAGTILAAALSVASVVLLALTTNLLAAALTGVAIIAYALGYTMWLKRRTPQNIVWGGAAGCMPVLIGWTAVTGSLDWTPVVLFLIVFFWTPPHYWPLSLRFRDDYARASVPMLPVVADRRRVARNIAGYSVVMVATSLILVPVAAMGWVYALSAVLLGAVFLGESLLLWRRVRVDRSDLHPMRLFHLSITYLALLFLAVAVDPFWYLPITGA